MTVYVVQYHSNAWGDQMSSDDILGIYTSEEKAIHRANTFEEKLAYDDDVVSVCDYELDNDYPSYLQGEYDDDYDLDE